MKNLFFVSLMLVLGMTACGGGGNAVDATGTWALHSVSGEELSEAEKSTTITLKDDGTFVQKRGDRERKGKWEIMTEEDKQYFVLKRESGEVDEKSEILTLDDTTLKFLDRGNEVTLKKQ